MAFGERLQALRRARGLTQEDLAAELKVSRQAVSKWESCRGYPELEKILYICNRYGVTLNDLFQDEVPVAGQVSRAAPAQMAPRTLRIMSPRVSRGITCSRYLWPLKSTSMSSCRRPPPLLRVSMTIPSLRLYLPKMSE